MVRDYSDENRRDLIREENRRENARAEARAEERYRTRPKLLSNSADLIAQSDARLARMERRRQEANRRFSDLVEQAKRDEDEVRNILRESNRDRVSYLLDIQHRLRRSI